MNSVTQPLASASPSSNLRPLSIFTFYLVANALLILLALRSVYNTYSIRPHHDKDKIRVRLLTRIALAIVSLAVTWYFMIRFFVLSYRSWAFADLASAASLSPALRLGPWLRDVKLFRDAWETVVETPARTCWSMPIFFITTAWSFFIAKEATRRQIRHAWAYMVIGQFVAISFAMNLFYMAVAVHPLMQDGEVKSGNTVTAGVKNQKQQNGAEDEQEFTSWTVHGMIYAIINALTYLSVLLAVTPLGRHNFLLFLALPHILLLLPPILHDIVPRRFGNIRTAPSTYESFYNGQFRVTAFVGSLFEAVALYYALYAPLMDERHLHRNSNVHIYLWNDEAIMRTETAYQSLYRSLLDHPAVSSVGCDVVLCTISFLTWRSTAL